LRENIGVPIWPADRAAYERAVEGVRAQLGEQALAATWTRGRTMTPEQALATREPMTMSTQAPTEPLMVPCAPKAATYPNGLTAREVEVLRLVAQGLTDAQVAEQLVISPHTVNAHLGVRLSHTQGRSQMPLKEDSSFGLPVTHSLGRAGEEERRRLKIAHLNVSVKGGITQHYVPPL
jgi:predicted DNA-binding protein (UPF0251 family)